jgi:hypothetical protein
MAAKKSFEPQVLVGSGTKVVRTGIPEGYSTTASFTHDGESNFIVEAFSDEGTSLDTLVNVIGVYAGTVLVNNGDGNPGVLQIDADGDWTVVISGVENAPTWDTSEKLTGEGDAVFLISDSLESFLKIVAKVRGEGNFYVRAYHGDDWTGLFNEIDAYTGETIFPKGTFLLTVGASGMSWSLALQSI